MFSLQIVAYPSYEDIPYFKGSIENEHRLREFEHMRCHQWFYSIYRHGDVSEYCKKPLTSMSFYVFDGAHGKFF